jgi:hypothetical protein
MNETMRSSLGFNADKRRTSSSGNDKMKKFRKGSSLNLTKEVTLPGHTNPNKKKDLNLIGEALKKKYIEPTAHSLAKDSYFRKQQIEVSQKSKLEIALKAKINKGLKNFTDEKEACAHIEALRTLK